MPGATRLRLDTLGYQAAEMDNVRTPAKLAAYGIAARLPRRGRPGSVLTAADQASPPGNPRQSRGGRELAA
jgi:hypothetical protein